MKVREFIRLLEDKLSNLQPLENIILFESSADYTDNTKAVFDEMIRRGINDKFRFIWVCKELKNVDILNEKFNNVHNVEFIYRYTREYKYYYSKKAKILITCNTFLEKSRKEQYYCFLSHGCPLKNSSSNYVMPENCYDVDVMTLSEFFIECHANVLNCSTKGVKPLGFPRTDALFNQLDLKKVFTGYDFKKLIYWLPTYRQTPEDDIIHSDISIPIVYNYESAKAINDCARSNDVLVVVKLHQIQNMKRIKEYNISNLLFINEDYLLENELSNYEVLGNCDAMITDYSSVYYDFLLCDKPVGLCWEDYDEYERREGFAVDMNRIMAGGVKIYNTDDFCKFISSVANDEDVLKKERREVRDLVHDHIDNQSTKRVVDYLESQIKMRV